MKRSYFFHVLRLFFIYLLLWLILSGGVFDLFAFIAVAALSLATPFIFSLHASFPCFFCLCKLLFFFLYNSTKGALQVSKLALMPKHCLTPFIYELPL
ncbi:MAG: Na+/H+ antiporter subunit E, partial [Campylobacterota bacterium]